MRQLAEIKKPLRHLQQGDVYVADADGAYVIEEAHTHSDILRFMIADVGKDDVRAILETME